MSIRFSVIITLYNKAPYIERTLRSVLNQSSKPYEIVIVDDVSTDGSLDLVRTFLTDNPTLCAGVVIQILMHVENLGPSAARNTALRAITGDYVFLLDADDEYHQGLFCKVEHVFSRYNPALLFLQFERDPGGRVLPSTGGLLPIVSELEQDVYAIPNIVAAFGDDHFGMNGSSVVCKRSALEGILYQENLNCFEGLEFWYRVVKASKDVPISACFLSGVNVTIHLTENSVSRKLVDKGGEIYLPVQFAQLRGSSDPYDQKLRHRIYIIWMRNAFLKLPRWRQRLRFIWRFRKPIVDNMYLNWRYPC